MRTKSGRFKSERVTEHREVRRSVEGRDISVTIPDYCSKAVLVLGCGNVLFGDDGFGPAVARFLQEHVDPPQDACVIDAGTGVREILFDIVLSDRRPQKIIIVDAVDKGLGPGELLRAPIDFVPLNKLHDFSVHQIPTSNLLYELRDSCGVDVELFACQVQDIPQSVCPGLSVPVQAAVPRAAEMIIAEVESVRKATPREPPERFGVFA